MAKKNGSGKWYFESGQLKYEGNWKNGKQDGVEMAYFASGQLKQEAYLRDGRAQGIYKEYSQTGELLIHMKYENGELIDLK
jgi:antitoxin component YwqK of YwqJK toxin-antitoxin module